MTKYIKRLRVITQIFSIPIIFCFIKLLRIDIQWKNELTKNRKNLLIISNHQSKLDPFLILSALGLKHTYNRTPFRFPVMADFVRRFPLGILITLFGGYDIGKTLEEKARALFYTRNLIATGNSVLIFPEGKIVRGSLDFRTFQKGYTTLLICDPILLLVKIDNFSNMPSHFFKKERPRIIFFTVKSSLTNEEKQKVIEQFYAKK